MFPTENRLSPRSLAALSSDAAHRYPMSEGPDYFFGDVSGLGEIYACCAELACAFFSAEHAFVPFLSGLHTMHTVLTALCRHGDHLLILDPTRGGHYATGQICESYGYTHEFLPVDRSSCLIDIDRIAPVREPQMVYLDLSTIIRIPRLADLRAALPNTRICLDASHILGLLPATPILGQLGSAVDCISGSTHKTFPGPQKGIALTNDTAIAEKIAAKIPFAVSSGHSANVAALAITLEELLPNRVAYAKQVIENASALACSLDDAGFSVPGADFGFTETHQVWIEPPLDSPAKEWGKRLAAANIRSTTVALPSSGRAGLRLGVQELTRLGMGTDGMQCVAGIFRRALLDNADPTEIAIDVKSLVSEYPTVHFTTPLEQTVPKLRSSD